MLPRFFLGSNRTVKSALDNFLAFGILFEGDFLRRLVACSCVLILIDFGSRIFNFFDLFFSFLKLFFFTSDVFLLDFFTFLFKFSFVLDAVDLFADFSSCPGLVRVVHHVAATEAFNDLYQLKFEPWS